MAKYDWAKIRDDYEIRGKSYSELQEAYGCSRGLISGRAKKDGWNRTEIEQEINRRASVIKGLHETEQKNRTLGERSVLIDAMAAERAAIEPLVYDGAKKSIQGAIDAFKDDDKEKMASANMLSQIACRVKDSVFGKMPTTQVNIQNNIASDTDAVLERLSERHQ